MRACVRACQCPPARNRNSARSLRRQTEVIRGTRPSYQGSLRRHFFHSHLVAVGEADRRGAVSRPGVFFLVFVCFLKKLGFPVAQWGDRALVELHGSETIRFVCLLSARVVNGLKTNPGSLYS